MELLHSISGILWSVASISAASIVLLVVVLGTIPLLSIARFFLSHHREDHDESDEKRPLAKKVRSFLRTNQTSNVLYVESVDAWRYHPLTMIRRISSTSSLADDTEDAEKKSEKTGKKVKVVEDASEVSVPTWGVIGFDYDERGRKSDYGFGNLVDEVVFNHGQTSLAGVVVVINSPGGYVFEYGKYYAHMLRLRALNIPVVVCIDGLGASGGYLMALPGTKIIAGPFAIVGSVGVVAQILNFYEMLKTLQVRPLLFTAGERKRVVTAMHPVSEEQEQYYTTRIADTHAEFLACVRKFRPQARLDEIQSGDHWSAQESVAKGLGLVDEIGTSNDHLMTLNREADLLHFERRQRIRGNLMDALMASAAEHLELAATRVLRSLAIGQQFL